MAGIIASGKIFLICSNRTSVLFGDIKGSGRFKKLMTSKVVGMRHKKKKKLELEDKIRMFLF
jgi:hypothetical protein